MKPSGLAIAAVAIFATQTVWADADWASAPDWKFVQELNGAFWACDFAANNQRLMHRTIGSELNAPPISSCKADAEAKALRRLPEAVKLATFPDEVKDTYAKWLTYLESVSVYSEPNPLAKTAYEAASNKLKTDLQAR